MQKMTTVADSFIAEFKPGGCYRFLCGGLQADSWENGNENGAVQRLFERGCCLRLDTKENEYIFRGVLLGAAYLFRVHPDEIRNAARYS